MILQTVAGESSLRGSFLTHLEGLVSSLAWHLGRLKIATGIATLAAATAILFVSGGRNRGNVNLQASAKIIPLVLAGISLFFLTSSGDSKQSGRRAPRTVRTG